jgi:hypothetical protein
MRYDAVSAFRMCTEELTQEAEAMELGNDG